MIISFYGSSIMGLGGGKGPRGVKIGEFSGNF